MDPTTNLAPVMASSIAPLIAVVGADGSGKSTICAALLGVCREYGPADTRHLGIKSGVLGRRIAALPLIGPLLFRKITKNAVAARDKEKKLPGLPTALVIYVFSALRLRRFKAVLALRKDGIIILSDRYPQTDVPGFFDGPGLSAARAEGMIAAWLSRRERAHFDWMVSHAPSLVIRLNVDLETAFARKPDHRYASLKAKIEAVPKLTYGPARIVELDSCEPVETVIARAEVEVRALLVGLGYCACAAS